MIKIFGNKKETPKEVNEVDYGKKTFYCEKCGKPATSSEEGFRYDMNTGKMVQKDIVWNCMNPDCYGNPIMRITLKVGSSTGRWMPTIASRRKVAELFSDEDIFYVGE
jgi:hypothetical protein